MDRASPQVIDRPTLDILERERHSLLESLSLEPSDGCMWSLTAVQRRYNEVVDEISERTRIPLQDPLHIFPQEIWEKIFFSMRPFKFVALGYFMDRLASFDEFFSLLNVSRLWFRQLTSAPLLWTWIFLGHEQEDELAKVAASLQLSGTCQLAVHLHGNKILSKDVHKLLIPHKDRIRTLHFSTPTSEKIIYDIMKQLGCLHNLKWILASTKMEDANSEVSPISFENAPYLESYRNWLTPEQVGQLRSRHLTLLHIQFPMVEGPASTSTQLHHISDLESIRFLDIKGPYKDIIEILNHCRGPLDTLVVRPIYFTEFEGFLRDLSRYPIIRSLIVHITYKDLPLSPSHLGLPVLKTRSLTVNIAHTVLPSLLSMGLQNKIALQSLKILEISIKAMPHLHSLTINTPALSNAAFQILPMLQLQELNVCRYWSGSEKTEPLSLDSISTLQLSETMVNGFPHPLSTSGLKKYTILNSKEFGGGGGPFFLRGLTVLPHGCKSTLVYLELDSIRPVIFPLRDLESLRELKFGSKMCHLWAGDVLEQLVVLPIGCPSLRWIGFDGLYREWDLLILLLERRNFLLDTSIRRIEEIEFNQRMSYKLLRTISLLLGGRFAERGCLEEYSIEAISNLISKRNRCWYCSYGLIECQRGIQETVLMPTTAWFRILKSGWTYKSSIEGVTPSPPLHEGITTWLAGKWSRRVAFAKLSDPIDQERVKYTLCSWFLAQPPKVIVTASLNGIWSE